MKAILSKTSSNSSVLAVLNSKYSMKPSKGVIRCVMPPQKGPAGMDVSLHVLGGALHILPGALHVLAGALHVLPGALHVLAGALHV